MMLSVSHRLSVLCVISGFSLSSILCANETTAAISYEHDVKPLLLSRCTSCHGALKQKGALRLDAGVLLMKGGQSGAVVTPGKPESSALIERLTSKDHEERMPPEGKPLTEHEISVFQRWIAAGAPLPAEEDIPSKPDEHWFFKAPQKAAVPAAFKPEASANPIDRFLAATWQKKGLTPQAPAPKAMLLRRVYLDLIGIPPTAQEAQAFEADAAPDAFNKVVESLLKRPEYGQRWGRHFMDVWRYSDELVENDDGLLVADHHMWRWRDWIVNAFNANKSYDRMIAEMLAGDEIAPTDNEVLAATGYLVRDWTLIGNREVWLQNAVEYSCTTFLGMTAKCARCHDHKYDPISHADYYKLRAVFEPLGKRVDFLPGNSNPVKLGLPRVFDEHPQNGTCIQENGNPHTPLKNGWVQAAALPALKAGELQIAEIPLPDTAVRPGRIAYVREDRLRDATAALTSARDAHGKNAATANDDAVVALNMLAEPASALAAATPLPPAMTLPAAAALVTQCKLQVADGELAVLHAAIALEDARGEPRVDLPLLQRRGVLLQMALKRHRAELAMAETINGYFQTAEAEKNAADKSHTETKRLQWIAAFEKYAKQLDDEKKPLPPFEPLWKTYPAKSTGKRLAFAKWIGSRNNPATARVFVNHVWMRHFGQPLVESVFEFGLHGKKPVQPELLDWLAVEFMESGWDIKRLHTLMVTSQAYQMSSARQPGSANEKLDSENRYTWRMNSQRMQAEQVRDSILAVSGKLDCAAGGPSIPPAQSDRVFRRSMYFKHCQGASGDKMLAMFDAPDPNECYRRNESIVPQQSLVLANSRLSFEQSRFIAREIGQSNVADGAFIAAAFNRVLGRAPTSDEEKLCVEFLVQRRTAQAQEQLLGTEKETLIASATDPVQRGREALVQVLLNHTDFVTIR